VISQIRSSSSHQARLLIALGIVIVAIGAMRLAIRYHDLIIPPSTSSVSKTGRSSAAVGVSHSDGSANRAAANQLSVG
jgi:hypothetical protein